MESYKRKLEENISAMKDIKIIAPLQGQAQRADMLTEKTQTVQKQSGINTHIQIMNNE